MTDSGKVIRKLKTQSKKRYKHRYRKLKNSYNDGLIELEDVFADVILLLLPVWGLFYLVYAPFAFPEGISNFFIGATEFVFSPILAVVYVIQNLT